MNKSATSKNDILKVSRSIVLKNGIHAFSMRNIALECGVAVGSVYNYFPSKSELLSATIESVWEEIFKPLKDISQLDCFVDCISFMYDTIKNGDERFPGFFTVHSLKFASEDIDKGKEMMEKYFDHLKNKLIDSLKRDKNVRKNAFDNSLSKELFVDYIFSLLITIFVKRKEDCMPLLEMIRQCIY